jgi:hypothetical protein
MLFGYLFLLAAVLFENLGTAALKGSNGLRKLLPGAVAVVGYIVSFSLMGQALARLPLAIAYSIWSGLSGDPDRYSDLQRAIQQKGCFGACLNLCRRISLQLSRFDRPTITGCWQVVYRHQSLAAVF